MEKKEKNTILRVIVGSQAHGLATPASDFDFRGVFITPTSEILKLGGHSDQTSWIEGKEDDTSWELQKFLFLSTKCNPTILETYLAPIKEITSYGEELRALFPYVWNSNDVKNAFCGYGVNQRKKFFDNKDRRAAKYACAYLRTLYNAWELLSTGSFNVSLIGTPVYEPCKRFKETDCSNGTEAIAGEVIDLCLKWEKKINEAYAANPDKKTNMEPINEFLLKVRKENW